LVGTKRYADIIKQKKLTAPPLKTKAVAKSAAKAKSTVKAKTSRLKKT